MSTAQQHSNSDFTPAHSHHGGLSAMRLVGLILFLVGMATFTATIFLGNYQIDLARLDQASEKVPAEVIEKLSPIAGKTFDSKVEMLNAIESSINADGSIQPYQLGVYKLWLMKDALRGPIADNPWLWFLLSVGLASLGGILFHMAQRNTLPGIKHDHIWFSSMMNRGIIGILTGTYLILFYILLYWNAEYFTNTITMFDPISQFIRNLPADQWFLYGFLYTMTIVVMGVRMFLKYRHNNYHLIRTASIIFFQFGFAFLLPSLMERFSQPSMDLKNAWPLNYSFFMDWNLSSLLSSGNFGLFLLVWGTILSVVLVPLFTYLYGKRWYCSWVCGCGGLAETLGDPYRQLSNKGVKAWQVERIMIHSVLVFAVIMTVMQIVNYTSGGAIFGDYTWRVNQTYSFLIGSAFAGVVGTGFYPFMGNRVWCRFGCPLAAILGIVQKIKSRFVITTNGGQCISCGNCSTYCEMGIDVRWYAQRGQNIIRNSCVGCGVCAAVCPRGVLRLENVNPDERFNVVLDDEVLHSVENLKKEIAA